MNCIKRFLFLSIVCVGRIKAEIGLDEIADRYIELAVSYLRFYDSCYLESADNEFATSYLQSDTDAFPFAVNVSYANMSIGDLCSMSREGRFETLRRDSGWYASITVAFPLTVSANGAAIRSDELTVSLGSTDIVTRTVLSVTVDYSLSEDDLPCAVNVTVDLEFGPFHLESDRIRVGFLRQLLDINRGLLARSLKENYFLSNIQLVNQIFGEVCTINFI